MTYSDDSCQVFCFDGTDYVLLSVYEAMKRRALLWRQEARQAQEKAAELGSEVYLHQEIAANPNMTDKDKIFGIVYTQWYNEAKPARENGARYYDAQAIATRMGSPRTDPHKPSPKEQAISPVHTKFKNAGLILTTTEQQKYNKGRQNQYDVISPQFTLAARHVALEKSEKAANRGGRRVALHRECGGLCVERTTYSCMKCGHTVPQDHVLMIDEEKWNSWGKDATPCVHCGEEVPPAAVFCPACGCEQEPGLDTTLEIPAIVPETPRLPVTQATLAGLAPASAPAEPILLRPLPPFPDRPCEHCGRPQRVCFAMSPAGVWDFTCTRDMWIA